MDNNKKLVMGFKTTADKSSSITLDNPKEDLSKDDIKQAMQLIIDKNIFAVENYGLSDMSSAKVVETSTTVYDLI